MESRRPDKEVEKRVVRTFKESREEVGLSGQSVALALGFSKRQYNYMERLARRPVFLYEAIINVISDEALRGLVDDIIDFCVKQHNYRVRRKLSSIKYEETFSHLDSTKPPVRKEKRKQVKKRRWRMPKIRKYPLRKEGKFFSFNEKPWYTIPRHRRRIEEFGVDKAERLLNL